MFNAKKAQGSMFNANRAAVNEINETRQRSPMAGVIPMWTSQNTITLQREAVQ